MLDYVLILLHQEIIYFNQLLFYLLASDLEPSGSKSDFLYTITSRDLETLFNEEYFIPNLLLYIWRIGVSRGCVGMK